MVSVVQSELFVDGWRVDHEVHGEQDRSAIFFGPEAKQRATSYAAQLEQAIRYEAGPKTSDEEKKL